MKLIIVEILGIIFIGLVIHFYGQNVALSIIGGWVLGLIVIISNK